MNTEPDDENCCCKGVEPEWNIDETSGEYRCTGCGRFG